MLETIGVTLKHEQVLTKKSSIYYCRKGTIEWR